MSADILDTVVSLTALMTEESEMLAARGPHPVLPEIAEAKVRLVASLETQIAQLARERPDWMEALEPEARETLANAMGELRDAGIVNAEILSRQIELTGEMMAAVAAEAQRIMGTRHGTYGAHGALFQIDQPTPISLNTSL